LNHRYKVYAKLRKFDPVYEDEVGIPGSSVAAIGGKNQATSIRGEHGKRIKGAIKGDLFQAGAIEVDHKKVKGETTLAVMVGGKDNSASIGVKIGCPIGSPKAGDLTKPSSIQVASKKFHTGGGDQSFGKQLTVLG
jgi:hypothetical protein